MGYQDALAGIMPVEWLDPYGRTPFADGMETSVDITIVETDDGIKASSVKNPPESGPSRLMQAIQQALGVDHSVCGPLCSSPQADDQGKQNDSASTGKSDYNKDKDSNDEKGLKNVVSDDKMKSTSPSVSRGQGSQPWAGGKSEGPRGTSEAAGSQ